MKRIAIVVFGVALLLAAMLWTAGLAGAGAPPVVSYQGQVTVSGTPYSGTGYFKFAIVDGQGLISYWSNDGTSVAGSEPDGDVALAVVNGGFAVLLGDPARDDPSARPGV